MDKQLIVVDINDTLCKKYHKKAYPVAPYKNIPYVETDKFYIYPRPHLNSFISFLLNNYKVAIWTSMLEKNATESLRAILSVSQIDRLEFIITQSEIKDEIKTRLNDFNDYSRLFFIDNDLNKVNRNSINDYYIITIYNPNLIGDNALFMLQKALPLLI